MRFSTQLIHVFASIPLLALVLANDPHHVGGHAPWHPWRPTETWDPFCAPTGRPHFAASPIVVLPSGPVMGTTTSLPSATVTVNKFLGIPFAQSPPERFSPPGNVTRWRQPLNATAFKPACIQQFNCKPATSPVALLTLMVLMHEIDPLAAQQFTEALFNNPAPEESEDCLYLNVFAPSTPAPQGGRAVLFWIYGGSLQFGSAGLPTYDGSSFAANQDVIVVTTNYRTNVFGFSNSPEIAFGQQNSGFLDQRKALSWVQANVARFGGNPDAVTIFGESAGGYSEYSRSICCV
jgi:carboxylesterase type B